MKTKFEELSEHEKIQFRNYLEKKHKGKLVLAGLIRQSDLNDVDVKAVIRNLSK